MQKRQSAVDVKDGNQVVDRIAVGPSFLYFPSSSSLAADVVLLPGHLVKVRERESRPRSKMDAGGKKPSSGHPPQDDNVYRSRNTAPHRSHSDVRILERDGVKPVLILQNKSEPQKFGLNGRGKNLIGQKVAIGSYDRVFAPVSVPNPASMVRRSSSVSPEMDRVRDWLHRNDFSQGLDGVSEKRHTKRSPLTQDKNGVIVTTSSTVAAESNPSHVHSSPPPPPPPAPSTLPKNIGRQQQHIDFHPKPIGSATISPETSSTPKLLFSSEMAAKRKSHMIQNVQQHPPDSETCRSPTTPSEKHLENLVDSIFATALSGEITSPESTRTGRSFRQRRSLGAICMSELTNVNTRSPPLEYPTSNKQMFGGRDGDHYDNGSGVTALMAELKGKLKAKGLGDDQSENYHGQQNGTGQTNDAVDSRVSNRHLVSDIVNGGALPNVNLPSFQPLASSTPPPQSSTIIPVPKSSTITPPPQSSTLSPPPLCIQEPASPTPSFVFPPPPPPLPSVMWTPQKFATDFNIDQSGISSDEQANNVTAKRAILTSSEFDRNTGDNHGQNVSLDVNPTPRNFWRYDDQKSQTNMGLSHLVTNDADGSWGTTSDLIQGTETGETINRYQLAEPGSPGEQVQSRRSPDWPRGLKLSEINSSRDVQTSPGLSPNRTSRVRVEADHEGNLGVFPASFGEIPARSGGSWEDLRPENNVLHHRVQDDFGKISIEKINIAESLAWRENDHEPIAPRESYCITNYNGLRDLSVHSELVSYPVDSVYPPFDNVSKFNSKGSNLRSYHGKGYFNERYDESTTWDTTAPDHVTGEQNARGGRGLNEGAVLPRLPGPALSCRNKQTHATGESRREIYDQSTHFSDYYLPTTGDGSEPFWSVRLSRDDIPPFVEQNKACYEEYATAFGSGEDSRTIVTWLRHDYKTPDSKSHENFRPLFGTVGACVVYPEKGSNSHYNATFDAFNQVSADDFENDVAVSSYDKVGGFSYISHEEGGRNHAFTKVKFKESLNEDLSGWTSSSSSDSDKTLQRFTSAAISQKTFNTIFTHGAKLSLRARADRTLTGSHHNLILSLTRGFSSEDDSEDGVGRGRWSRQARSAPSSARKQKKKKRSQSLSSRKHISESFFIFDNAANPAPTSEATRDSQENNDVDDPASPTTVSIFSNNNGSKVVKIYRQRSKESSSSPVESTQGYNNTMLGSNNHNHEILPPSASGPSSGGKKNGSLVRSKSLFTSTPSLFTRTTPEEKFWKKELKKEKEAKKKFEEERKKVEKQEEKRRKKEEKKAATLGPAGVPKNWNQVSRTVENVYMRPGLRMTAVPIEYMDYSRTSAFMSPANQTGPPTVGHYSTVNGPHIRGVSSVDYARVEQVYGTSHRRPVPTLQVHQQYSPHYGYTHNRQQLPRVVLLHRSADGYGFVLRGAKSKLPMGGGFNDFSPTPEYPALQYLDSVDPGSQADRAGLKGGDFILEINGENVVRASHEHVVHLIRSSSDVLSMRVLTVTPSDHMPADWQTYQDSGAMTLPSRKKTAAPLPPQRDPRTSLSYSKGSSKSMTEGLAEIEKLDAAIAEFETLDDMQGNYYNSDDHKMAMMRANAMVVTDEGYDGAYREEGKAVSKAHMSPAEARIQKYHKTATSQALERSKSTPDIAGAIGDQYADRHHAGGHIGGSWTKKQAPAPPRQEVHIGISLAESGPYPPRNDASRTPNLPHRAPGVPENSASAPHTPEFSRILASRTENEKHRRTESQGTNAASTYKNNQNGDKSISFADEKVMENANKFIQKYPNATLLVTADIHSNKLNGSKDRVLYEPDPDYDSDDERSTSTKTSDTIHSYSGGRLNTNAATDSNSPVRQNKSSVTVISINNDANRDRSKQTVSSHSSSYLINGSKSSPKPVHVHDNVALTSPVQSLSSSRRSSGVVMATPSQPSSAESSRRSSIQSNYSGDAGDKSNKTHMISSASATAISSSGRSLHEAEIPPPPPPPPPVLAGGKSTPPGGSANSTLRHRPNEMGAAGPLQSRVSTDDILAAVAERRNRLETEGPRFSEVRTLSASKSTQEMNHEALVAAVAKRKTLLEQGEDNTVVNDIESRLNRNKKLQAAKYFNSNINRGSQDAGKDGQSGANSLPPSASSGLKLEEQAGKNVTTAAKEIAGFDKPEPQAKLPTPVPLKSNKSEVIPSKTVEADNVGSIDFRARLKPVDVKGAVSNIAVHSKTSLSSSAASAPGTNVTTIVMSKAGSNKVGAPPTPPAPTTTLTGQFPPPPPATSAAPPPPPPPSSSAPIITSKSKADLQATSNKTGQSSTETIKSPISPTSPNNNTSDYIALAEKARQEYLKKKASGSLQANIERKGPVEITPNRKNFPRGKTTSPASPTSPSDSNSLAQTKPAQETKRDTTQVSVQDRIKTLQPNNKTVVAGVTEDHSHTELSLSNGTTRKPKSSISITPHQNVAPPSSKVAPPTLVHSNKSGNPSTGRGVALNIIPPPTSFGGTTGSPDSAFSQDDAASFVSSASSLSTASSEHGGRQTKDFKDLLAHSPPPPPDFNDFSLGDQDAFIPPPPEFLEIDSNANESKRMDENSKPFANKAASSWSCVDVLDWLDSLGLPQYRIGFAKAGVDGPKLVNMGRNEFIDLGVSQVGHRMSLERSVKKLNMGPSTNL